MAARQLSKTQPAITSSVQQLETIIGFKLLERTTRNVFLTEEGERFLPIAERLVSEFDNIVGDLRATAERRTGNISIAVVPSVATQILPKVVEEFSKRYPGISIRMIDDNTNGVQRRVTRNEVDFGIGGKRRVNEDLTHFLLIKDRMEMVCHKDNKLAEQEGPIEWSELIGSTFLDSGLHSIMEIQNLIAESKYEFTTTTLLFAMLEANLGVTVLPTLATTYERPLLKSRPLVSPKVERSLFLIARKEWSRSPAVEAFLEVAVEVIPQVIQGLDNEFLHLSKLDKLLDDNGKK